VVSGEQLDEKPVVSFEKRVELAMVAKDSSKSLDAWLNAHCSEFDLKLTVNKGLIFEPNASAVVSFLNLRLGTEVAANDASLLGSAGTEGAVTTVDETLYQMLTRRNVSIQTFTKLADGSPKNDREIKNLSPVHLIYADKANVQIGGQVLAPLASASVDKTQLDARGVSATKCRLPNDPGCDGQKVDISLNKGFVSAKAPASVEGWKVVVGYTDAAGVWQTCGSRTVKGNASSKMNFSLELPDAPAVHKANRSFEVRVYNDKGIPAERLTVPFREIGWATSAQQVA